MIHNDSCFLTIALYEIHLLVAMMFLHANNTCDAYRLHNPNQGQADTGSRVQNYLLQVVVLVMTFRKH